MRSRHAPSLLLLAAALFAPMQVALADTPTGTHHVRKGEVTVHCPMTVGGSFEAKTTAVGGQVSVPPGPGPLGGSFSVDLKTLDTGIDLRNQHLRETYLEVQKGTGFDTATLSNIKVKTDDLAGFEGKAAFTGTFELHGLKKEVAGQAEIRRSGGATSVEATFPLLVSDFAIKKPTYLGVGVKNEIKVRVSLDIAPVAATGAAK